MTATKFTAETAVQFDRFSIWNATLLATAAHQKGCTCEPYADWYTYRRWQAQGMQVQKGEHGVKLGILVPMTKKDDNGEPQEIGARPWMTPVFCRHQVKPATKEG